MGQLADYLAQHDDNFRKARLPALYSDFRPQRTLNPDGYHANLAAWRHALSRLAAEGRLSRQTADTNLLVLDLDNSLLRLFEHKQFGQPLALGTVVRETVNTRGFVPLQEFLKSPTSIYHHGWSEVPWNVLGWTLRQLGVVDLSRGDEKLPTAQYVIMDNVEAAGKAVADRMQDKTSRFDRIFTKAQFGETFATGLLSDQHLSEKDLDVLLRFLSRDKDMVDYDGKTVRVRARGEQRGITQEDAAIAHLKELIDHIQHQTSLLNKRIEELDQTARQSVTRNNRIAALAALKSKKLAEASLATRYGTLAQLEQVASRIEQAADQVQLVKVMEASTGALKGLNAEVGGVDRVDDVMDRLRQQMAETDEVGAILAEGGAVVDESEIDDELEALQRQEEEAKAKAKEQEEAAEAKKKMEELPEVPAAEDTPRREKETSPTTETGIAHLSLA